jgi:CheY-like chemotaxis protein
MEWTDQILRKRLKDCRILIVEDDLDLCPRLEQCFRNWDVKDVVVCRCVHGKTKGAIDLLRKDDAFSLICLDCILPWTEDNLRHCDLLQEEWDRLQAQITETPPDAKRLQKLRGKLDVLSDRMSALIDRDAGLRMVYELLRLTSNTESPGLEDTRSPIPILFLTARKQDAVSGEAKRPLPKNCRWLLKPLRERHLIEAAAQLIALSAPPC